MLHVHVVMGSLAVEANSVGACSRADADGDRMEVCKDTIQYYFPLLGSEQR